MIGEQASRFSIVRRGGALVSTGGGLSTTYGRLGPTVDIGDAKLALSLAGIGYNARTPRPGSAARYVVGNEISYRRSDVTDWYRNGPFGLEQGFTLRARPAGSDGRRWLTVAVHSSGAFVPSLHGSQVLFTSLSSHAVIARYGGLTAIDASGHALPAKLELAGSTLLLRVDDAGARYPLTIDPLLQQGSKLTPSDGVGNDDFGTSVALSSDGTTALIGGPTDNSQAGAAWVFTRSVGVWTQQGSKLTGSGETGSAGFGTSVALSSDGNTALVGGQNDSATAGAAWVFTRSGSTWIQQGSKLTGGGETGIAAFGRGVALSSDGNTAVIGGFLDNSGAGAAWVFTRSGGVWTQQGSKLTGGDEMGKGDFGLSVASSSDGNTALIGGYADNGDAGAAWVFTRSGGAWTQQGSKLTGNDETGNGYFGISVASSSDGNTALIGGYADNGNYGAAWVYTRSGGVWTQQGPKLTGTGEVARGFFGDSVALSSAGDTAVVGGPGDNGNAGAVWAFTRSDGVWTQQGSKLTAVGGTGSSLFGNSAALSADGYTALIGGVEDNGFAGAAWVFAITAPDAPTGVSALAGDGQATVSFTAPDFDGGSTVTGYTVTSSPGGATATGSSSPIAVTGLIDGTTYTFTVTATNEVGTGTASSASSAVTPLGTPGPPTSVSAAAGDGQATVSFNAPNSNGGSAITSYTVVASPGGATATGSSSPITVTGLADGTAYTFTVTATNVVGTSSGSASNRVIPVGPPNAAQSTLSPTSSNIVANGSSTAVLTVQVKDGGDNDYASGGTTVTITKSSGSGSIGPVTDNGDGTYTATITAPASPGIGVFSATVGGDPVKSGTGSQTLATIHFFPQPTITDFTPHSGGIHATVILTGTNLTGITHVRLNGTSAAFSVISDTELTFTVPDGATSGTLTVANPGATATSTGSFTVASQPTITSLDFTSGPVGTVVTIAGTNLTGTVGVMIGSIVTVPTSISATSVTFTIPPGAQSGPVKILATGGSATSTDTFTVTG